MTTCLLLLLVFAQAEEPDETLEPLVLAASPAKLHYRLSVEVSGLAFWSRARLQPTDGFAQVAPGFTLDGGDSFGMDLHAPLRLRSEDWDELSDFGQIVRELRLETDESTFSLWVGHQEEYTLLSGHLVSRYSNQSNPDYHPSGAYLTAALGPTYTELFTSDVLGARILAGELALDLEHLLGGSERTGRYSVSVSVAHDLGRAGGVSPEVTLAHSDVDVGLIFREGLQLFVFAGAGARLFQGGEARGALVGLSFEVLTQTLQVRGRLEARVQRGGFRQGFFGPDYELSRFTVPGPEVLPISAQRLPDGASGYGELLVSWDDISLEHSARLLRLSLAAESFTWGRLDVDARLLTHLLVRKLGVSLGVTGVEVTRPHARRYLASGEVRYHFLRRVYVVVRAGTLFFPRPDSTLDPGFFASLGLGAEHVR